MPINPCKISNTSLNKAGEILRFQTDTEQKDEAIETLKRWRMQHVQPLFTFNNTLKSRVKRTLPANHHHGNYIIAQRLKRLATIEHKLSRQPGMKLSRMQDIGGIRCVMPHISYVRAIEKLYTQTSNGQLFKHELKRHDDYINPPKETGYRGVHLIFKTVYKGKH